MPALPIHDVATQSFGRAFRPSRHRCNSLTSYYRQSSQLLAGTRNTNDTNSVIKHAQKQHASRTSQRCRGTRWLTVTNSDVRLEKQQPNPLRSLLLRSNDVLPLAVVATTVLALLAPSTFVFFTPQYFSPALGYLMFAVGVNLQPKAFIDVFKAPWAVVVGSVGQWVVKPALGVLVAWASGALLGLPAPVGTGIIMTACVSGAQLSSYATYLCHPNQAPLAIVLTALSTAAGVVITPALALLLLGTRVPLDGAAMSLSIFQIVIIPVAAGLLMRSYLPGVVDLLRPFFTFASLLVTCCCVGAPVSLNSSVLKAPGGSTVVLPVIVFHALAFAVGYLIAKGSVGGASVPLSRCICLTTGMQSSLLALLLASKFFSNPLTLLPCAVSVPIMTVGGFMLVTIWKKLDSSLTPAE